MLVGLKIGTERYVLNDGSNDVRKRNVGCQSGIYKNPIMKQSPRPFLSTHFVDTETVPQRMSRQPFYYNFVLIYLLINHKLYPFWSLKFMGNSRRIRILGLLGTDSFTINMILGFHSLNRSISPPQPCLLISQSHLLFHIFGSPITHTLRYLDREGEDEVVLTERSDRVRET